MLAKSCQPFDKKELLSKIQQKHVQVQSIVTSLIISQDSSIELTNETMINVLWAVQDLLEDAQSLSCKLQEFEGE